MLPVLFTEAFAALDAAMLLSTSNFILAFSTTALLITELFSLAFLAINLAAINFSLLLTLSFTTLLALLSEGLLALQLTSDLAFSLLSTNAVLFFTLAVEAIIAQLTYLNETIPVNLLQMETLFTTSFANISGGFSGSLGEMSSAFTTELGNMALASEEQSTIIKDNFCNAFKAIANEMPATKDSIKSVLDQIATDFSETAKSAKDSFADTEININQNLTSIETVTRDTTSKSGDSWRDYLSIASDVGGCSHSIGVHLLGAFIYYEINGNKTSSLNDRHGSFDWCDSGANWRHICVRSQLQQCFDWCFGIWGGLVGSGCSCLVSWYGFSAFGKNSI